MFSIRLRLFTHFPNVVFSRYEFSKYFSTIILQIKNNFNLSLLRTLKLSVSSSVSTPIYVHLNVILVIKLAKFAKSVFKITFTEEKHIFCIVFCHCNDRVFKPSSTLGIK